MLHIFRSINHSNAKVILYKFEKSKNRLPTSYVGGWVVYSRHKSVADWGPVSATPMHVCKYWVPVLCQRNYPSARLSSPTQ